MECIFVFLTFIFIQTGCHSFVTLSLDEMKTNSVNELLSDTTQSNPLTKLVEDKSVIEEQKNWVYPFESKQVNLEGQNLERLLSEFNVPKYEQMGPWLKQFSHLLIKPLEEETIWKSLDKKSVDAINGSLLKSSTLQNILDNLLDFSLIMEPKLNAVYEDGSMNRFYFNPDFSASTLNSETEINSVPNNSEPLSLIRNFFENLCRKHHSMLSKLSIEHNHYPSEDLNEPQKNTMLQKNDES